MTEMTWILDEPVEAIAFDFDGTMVAIEGIDELARFKDVYESVRKITQKAMDETGLTAQIYDKRLALIQPSRAHLDILAARYKENFVLDIQDILACLQALDKEIYVISSGLRAPILQACQGLNIPNSHIHAVDIYFHENGQYRDFDHSSPLIHLHGKATVIQDLCKAHQKVIFIGDGINDVLVTKEVTRFIGFGGVSFRENIQKRSSFYIRSASLCSILPLCLTEEEYGFLCESHQALYQKGMAHIHQGLVDMRPSTLIF